MPLLADRSSAFHVIATLLMDAPVETLKIQGLLYHDAFDEIRVDRQESPKAVLVRSGHFYAFFAMDERRGRALLDELDWSRPLAFGGVHEVFGEWIAARGEVVWSQTCIQYHLPDTGTVMEDLFSARGDDAHIMEPGGEHAELILRSWSYGEAGDPEDQLHIRERIATGMTSGWVEDHQLVCWAMTHADGSLGYMHTLDGYRRKGIARRVLADLALKVWNLGLTPFGYVGEGPRDGAVLSGLGFHRHPDRFLWLGIAPG